jgi:tRNA(Arg) A34 adenosine deaminase TadA
MCANAIWEVGVRKIVYGVRYESFKSILSEKFRYVSIEKVFELLDTPLESIGGVLEEECMETYKHWLRKDKNESSIR